MGGNIVCTFFGHRDIEEDISMELSKAIRQMIEQYGVTTFWCGGYGKFDLLAARTAHDLKKEFPQIQVVLVRAYLPKQGEESSDIYDASIYPEGLELVPKRFAISRRNQWMVQNCDIAITYVRHHYGGAYNAMQHVMRRNIRIVNLAEK